MDPQPQPIVRKRANIVYSSKYGELFNDDVQAPSGAAGRYLRWRWGAAGVVVVARSMAGTLFIGTHRYPPNLTSLELPRGACEPGETACQGAMRELLEESGYVADSLAERGTIYPDTGLIENGVTVVEASIVDPHPGDVRPDAEVMESVVPAVWLTDHEIFSKVADGSIKCGISLAAFTLCRAVDKGSN
jgi:8-oxo-dGTP pyrophosphatase MutT (NUDIX family)